MIARSLRRVSFVLALAGVSLVGRAARADAQPAPSGSSAPAPSSASAPSGTSSATAAGPSAPSGAASPAAAAPSAGAAPANATPAFESNVAAEPPRRWYGWQVMICDAVVAPQAFFAIKETSTILYITAGLTYAGCPMAVHLLHGQGREAGLSGGARIAVPGLLAGIGYLVGYLFPFPKKSGDSPVTYGALTGLGIGVGASVLFDWFYLSREEIPLWERAGVRLRPYTDGKTGGFVGTF